MNLTGHVPQNPPIYHHEIQYVQKGFLLPFLEVKSWCKTSTNFLIIINWINIAHELIVCTMLMDIWNSLLPIYREKIPILLPWVAEWIQMIQFCYLSDDQTEVHSRVIFSQWLSMLTPFFKPTVSEFWPFLLVQIVPQAQNFYLTFNITKNSGALYLLSM